MGVYTFFSFFPFDSFAGISEVRRAILHTLVELIRVSQPVLIYAYYKKLIMHSYCSKINKNINF